MTTRDWDDERRAEDAPAGFSANASQAWADGWNSAVAQYCHEKYIDRDELLIQVRSEGCTCHYSPTGQRTPDPEHCAAHGDADESYGMIR